MAEDYSIFGCTTTSCYASGTSVVFEKTCLDGRKSMFTIAVLPSTDMAEKKDIIALTDDKVIKGGFLRTRTPNSSEVIAYLKEWGANAECITKATELLRDTLRTSKIIERESIEGTLGTTPTVKAKYEKETKSE